MVYHVTANRIGRITSTDQINEYAVPTPNDGLSAITGPVIGETTICNSNTLWFIEANAGKIGRSKFVENNCTRTQFDSQKSRFVAGHPGVITSNVAHGFS